MLDRIVLQYGTRTLKGYTDKSLWTNGWDHDNTTPPIRLPDSEDLHRLPIDGIKAVFFVKTFEGKSHEDLRFHDHLPAAECLWVRVTFHDGEVIEGLIHNSHSFVLSPGFLLTPIDPEGNNHLVYLFKTQLKAFEVLGLRASHPWII